MRESAELLIEHFSDYSRILIAGEEQSGKTTLLKKIFIDLRGKNYVPVYINDEDNYYQGQIQAKIEKAYKEQYTGVTFSEFDKRKIIPLIDNFHSAKHKEKVIQDLTGYKSSVLTVDDVFTLNFKDENLIESFTRFKIKDFSPTLRNELIKKWTHLSDKKGVPPQNDVDYYKKIDSTTELVNTALGKVMSSGIMPAYPFFILSIISSFETLNKPLDKEITSQGYCYQALIYIYLRKQDVKNNEIDTYINFLTEFAFHLFKEKKQELSNDDFDVFMTAYLDKFIIPFEKEKLLSNLQKTKIISLDSCNNYSFCYPYLYYYFVAKFLAEHKDENKPTIENVINNLHINENAYIAIFISHHAKNVNFLNEIIATGASLFNAFSPATLSKEELSFFDNKLDIIVKAVLPQKAKTAEKERAERLQTEDDQEKIKETTETDNLKELEEDEMAKEFRRSIKTVEVMGCILKNRAGSLEKITLEKLFTEAMKIQLRSLNHFFSLIQDEKSQQEIIEFLTSRIDIAAKGRPNKLNTTQLTKLSETIFWNICFFTIYGFLDKVVRSLGSDSLREIVELTCEKENTPASFIIKHGILMWYNKNLQVEKIADRIDNDGFAEIAKRILRFMIVNHCTMHHINYKDMQKISQRFQIPTSALQIRNIGM